MGNDRNDFIKQYENISQKKVFDLKPVVCEKAPLLNDLPLDDDDAVSPIMSVVHFIEKWGVASVVFIVALFGYSNLYNIVEFTFKGDMALGASMLVATVIASVYSIEFFAKNIFTPRVLSGVSRMGTGMIFGMASGISGLVSLCDSGKPRKSNDEAFLKSSQGIVKSGKSLAHLSSVVIEKTQFYSFYSDNIPNPFAQFIILSGENDVFFGKKRQILHKIEYNEIDLLHSAFYGLAQLVKEREHILQEAGIETIEEYNKSVPYSEKLYFVIILADNLEQLQMRAGNEFIQSLLNLRNQKVGIYLFH